MTRVQLANRANVFERVLASLELGDLPGIQLDKLLAVCKVLGIELVRPGRCRMGRIRLATASAPSPAGAKVYVRFGFPAALQWKGAGKRKCAYAVSREFDVRPNVPVALL